MIWIQPPFMPASTRLSSLKASSPFSVSQRSRRYGVERHAEAVAVAVREHLLDVGADLAAHRGARREERVVGRRGAVVVEPQDDAGEVGVVGGRPAERVVDEGRVSGTGRWAGSASSRGVPGRP